MDVQNEYHFYIHFLYGFVFRKNSLYLEKRHSFISLFRGTQHD